MNDTETRGRKVPSSPSTGKAKRMVSKIDILLLTSVTTDEKEDVGLTEASIPPFATSITLGGLFSNGYFLVRSDDLVDLYCDYFVCISAING